jgi:large subunit ribosomal protein L20
MSRVKRSIVTRRRHKRLLKQTKGFWGQRKNIFKRAKETLLRAFRFAYVGRRIKKRDYKSLFITRINAACRRNEVNYSAFIVGLKKAQIQINKKMLSQLAIFEPKAFSALVAMTKK